MYQYYMNTIPLIQTSEELDNLIEVAACDKSLTEAQYKNVYILYENRAGELMEEEK